MKKVLCIGDLALDVIAQLKESINYGNDTASRISTHPGGQAANVSTWITRTNTKAQLVARVGNDPVGFALISDLDKYGVEHMNLMRSGRPTGVVVILVDANGERTMFPDNGANADLEVNDLPPLDGIDGAYISGYALLDFRSRDAVLAMVKKIKAAGIPIYFDPTTTGAMKIVSREEVLSWVALMDGILLNAEEALYLGDSTQIEIAEENLKVHTPLVVIKLGSRGAMAVFNDQSVRVAAVTTNVVDTTGAGDSFAAGFIPMWLETRELEKALSAGTALAAKCVATVGARPPLN
ncbi:MAG: carbohydrate kinase family protein [Actinomycetales bacterium]|nr:MAG: carbohydrate kinase family protein [Actinomycetales bacterium]